MTTPTATAPSTAAPTTPSMSPPMVGPDTKDGLSPADAKKMAKWTKQDLAGGKISQEQADTIFSDLNTPIEERALDTRTPEQKQLDRLHPPAKESEYTIRYGGPNAVMAQTPSSSNSINRRARGCRGRSSIVRGAILS